MDRYFEDYVVGERVETNSLTVTEAAIVAFAREYDPQSMHVDADAAKRGRFGRLIASGWQTAGFTMRLIVQEGVFGAEGGVGMGIDDLRWPRPVFPGDTLRVVAEVLELRPSSSRPSGVARFKLTTLNQSGDEVLTQVAIVMIPCRPAPSAA